MYSSLLLTTFLVLAAPCVVLAQGGNEAPPATGKNAPVDLAADSLQHDETGQTITAQGHVELVQNGRILKADKIVYNLGADTVTATGNVILTDPNGDVHFAETASLNTEMKNGFVEGLQSWLTNGGRFTAEEGRKEGEKVIMTNATYTPCECEMDDDGEPDWLIRAKEVTYHRDENRIAYKNASFEMFGVPVLWTPYLSHPDGKIKRKSGLLSPDAGYDSQLGLFVTNTYYWAIGPDKDATTGVMLMTQESPVALAGYRQRFAQANLEFNGSLTHSARTDQVAGEEVRQDEKWRGHLFSTGLWNIDEKWRAGLDLEMASDDQYMRQYDFSNDDVLENELYAERFSGRNYAVGRILAFQDIRVREERTDQPDVLPEFQISMLGEPNALLGGRWGADLSLLGLRRSGDGQDMNRFVGEAGWEKRHVTGFGLVNTFEASVRGDAYYVNDRDIADIIPGRNDQGAETRVFPRANMTTSLPMAREYTHMQAIVEPIAALTVSPDITAEDTDIPNEDSQDVQIDASNLFEPNRFPGRDRIEDGNHATVGLRTGLYGHSGNYIDVFAGQSFRFGDDDNPFPDGSGLSEDKSDIVGQISGIAHDRAGLNYRFQLDSASLASQRHEVDGFLDIGDVSLHTRYLFAKALAGTDIEESREQIQNLVAYQITDAWRIRTGALQDLGEDPGLRRAAFGLDYTGCCLAFSATAERTLTSDSSGDSGTDIMFRIGLKGLGDFRSSGSNRWDADRLDNW